MNGRYEMRFTGSGGQGVILCSIILAEAAFLAGKQVAQSQAYGPEARGGLCRAELVIDDRRIAYPKVTKADFLMALTQASLEKYGETAREDAWGLVDSSLDETNLGGRRVIKLPVLETAAKEVGRAMTANIVAVGAINELLEIVPDAVIEKAVRMRIPKGTEELNMKALEAGKRLGAAARER